MGPAADTADRGQRLWLGLAFVTALGVAAWPLLARMTVVVDDVGMLLPGRAPHGFLATMVAAWRSALFRPLLPFSAALLDAGTRSAVLIVPLQLLTFAAAVPALERLARRMFSDPLPAYATTTIVLLHPSTTVSLWQADTLSQTASATAGIWLFSIASGCWRLRYPGMVWTTVTILGLLSKETFLGWLVIATPIAVLRTRLPHFAIAGNQAPTMHFRGLASSVLLAIAFIAGRLVVLSEVGASEGRYALHFDVTMITNFITLGGGLLTFGPLHALRLSGPASPALWVAGIAVAVHASMLATITLVRSDRDRVGALWILAVIALGPVIPMGHVSELYLMGPNMLTALCLVRALTLLPQVVTPLVARAAVGLFFICAASGVVSRGYHFALTWAYGRSLIAQVRQMAITGIPGRPGRACPVHVTTRHSVYVTDPSQALNVAATTRIALESGRPLPPDWDAGLDCSDLPEHRPW